MNNFKRYQAKIPTKHTPEISQLNISNVRKDGEYLIFYTDSDGISFLKKLEIELEYRDILSSKMKFIFTKRIINVIGVLLLIVLLINQSFTVTKYHFVNPDYYDEDVIDFLDDYFYNIGPFRYLKKSLSEINYELRKKFFEYEWIGLKKEGSFLYIDIKKLDMKLTDPDNSNIVGDLVASKDAIIRYYVAQKGVVLIRELQAVSQGEVLISGNLLIDNEQIHYIRPSGFVIGEVIEHYHFSIPKIEKKEEKSGRLIEQKKLIFFNKNLTKPNNKLPYTEYIMLEEPVLSWGKFLKITNQMFYETITTTTQYSKEEAVDYAKSLIVKEFNSKKTTTYEKIIFIELMRVIEGKDHFEVMLIAKKYENIALFQEVIID